MAILYTKLISVILPDISIKLMMLKAKICEMMILKAKIWENLKKIEVCSHLSPKTDNLTVW